MLFKASGFSGMSEILYTTDIAYERQKIDAEGRIQEESLACASFRIVIPRSWIASSGGESGGETSMYDDVDPSSLKRFLKVYTFSMVDLDSFRQFETIVWMPCCFTIEPYFIPLLII
jgi:hypothetical protein